MKKITTSGFICLEDNYKFVYKIAKIEYNEWEDGTFNYIFQPYYNVIDIIPSNLFQGIPGLDLSLRKEIYERKNIIPTFISERTPSENREDLWDLLEECGMQVLNRLEWLTLTNKRYSGDRLFVIPFVGNNFNKYNVDSMYDLCNRADNICRELLKIICFGDYLEANDIIIDDTTRIYYYRILISMYAYEYNKKRRYINNGIENAKEKGVYKGRKQIKIDPLFFDKVMNDYLSKEITANEAAKLLKISLSTFFRRLKEKKKN